MKKLLKESKNDGFLNLFEEGIFVRSYEYSAIKIAEISGYRLLADIDKKSGMIFLTCAFPKDKRQEILKKIELEKDNLRIITKDGSIEEIYNGKVFGKDDENLIQIKRSLVVFD